VTKHIFMDIMYEILHQSIKNVESLGNISLKPAVKYSRFLLQLLSWNSQLMNGIIRG